MILDILIAASIGGVAVFAFAIAAAYILLKVQIRDLPQLSVSAEDVAPKDENEKVRYRDEGYFYLVLHFSEVKAPFEIRKIRIKGAALPLELTDTDGRWVGDVLKPCPRKNKSQRCSYILRKGKENTLPLLVRPFSREDELELTVRCALFTRPRSPVSSKATWSLAIDPKELLGPDAPKGSICTTPAVYGRLGK